MEPEVSLPHSHVHISKWTNLFTFSEKKLTYFFITPEAVRVFSLIILIISDPIPVGVRSNA